MSETSEILARLAALPDADLVAIMRAAIAGRPGLTEVGTALTRVASGNTDPDAPVTLDTVDAEFVEPTDTSHQVGTTFAVPPVPTLPITPATGGYTAGGVPTFDSVRGKVERRFGIAQGSGELDQQTPAGRSVEEQWEAREKAGRDRLEEIRKSMRDNK
ncbi:hypothetical protein [Nocardia camponoti]|uniref:PspA domain-containing protein n=1 Tax=Nocardia camponoti TaxID=1616106 RepID=A0A917QTF6_9NOCA|nr:hypothetical protein [Nocardia camponoti]GGK67700.1 hypothetical protein GCM10011591_44830 [Nocardia camponoti]